MRKLFEYGGIVASVILFIAGIGAIGAGVLGVNEVRDTLAKEKIVGTPDSSIPGQKVDSGSEAKAFAEVMRKHTLEITGGQVYAEMGRFIGKDGKPTSDEKLAAKGPNGQPVENPVRQVWVTETALSTALNTAFFAERVAYFSIAMGAALLLTGVGFGVLTVGGALRASSPAAAPGTRRTAAATS